MLKMFVETYAENFDIIHNHGLWSVASVGICAYAINDQATVDKAIYGLKGDSVSGGFIAQLTQLFSPDGYYMEGPYYHRFSLRPIFLFAETIERRQPEIGIYQLKDQVIKTPFDIPKQYVETIKNKLNINVSEQLVRNVFKSLNYVRKKAKRIIIKSEIYMKKLKEKRKVFMDYISHINIK